MKIFDIDELFEKYVRELMVKDAGKFTEEEWEDRIPALYEEFGNKPLSCFGGKSTVDYYASLSGKELCSLLKAHVEEEVSVSDYLCEAIVAADTEKGLMAFLKKGTDEELMSYAVNILNDKAYFEALPIYLDYVTDPETDDNMREIMGDVIVENASEIKEQLIKKHRTALAGKAYIVEALAGCERDERIFKILVDEFKKTKHLSAIAHLLAKYGDERAVEFILERMEEPSLKYADFAELKYAVEALGGEYTGKRDFTQDRTFKKIKGIKS